MRVLVLQEMRVLVLCALLGVLVLSGPAVVDAEACSSSSGCDDCAYSSLYWTWLCAKIERDAYCSCEQITGGCILSGSCDYTGSGGGEECGPNGFCPENQYRPSVSPATDSGATQSALPTLTPKGTNIDAAATSHELVPAATPEKSNGPEAAPIAGGQQTAF